MMRLTRNTRLTKADALRLTQKHGALPLAEKALAEATLTPRARQVLVDFVASRGTPKTGHSALQVLLARQSVDVARAGRSGRFDRRDRDDRVTEWLDDAARDIDAADARIRSLASAKAGALDVDEALRDVKPVSWSELEAWLDG